MKIKLIKLYLFLIKIFLTFNFWIYNKNLVNNKFITYFFFSILIPLHIIFQVKILNNFYFLFIFYLVINVYICLFLYLFLN